MAGHPTTGSLCLAIALLSLLTSVKCSSFTYNNRSFLLNGEPYQIIGGQMDPQRVPIEYWRQRLQMARAMGLNTIFSYVYWNNLEPQQGQWDFDGRNDIAKFFTLAQEEGLHVVLRPGPYICGEHEWGGFPAWLSQIPDMAVRQNNEPFLNASRLYIEHLADELKSLQINNGGPILMAQLENEYGSFASDKTYLRALADILEANFDVFLYTNDGGGQSYLEGGALDGILAEIDGDPQSGFAARDAYVNSSSLGPLLDGEFYITWLDTWAGPEHRTNTGNTQTTQAVLDGLEYILSNNHSFSIYMFHGGTNWGLENGAIWGTSSLQAVTTSYDYGAPLDESGRPSEIYYKIRDLISRYVPAGSIPGIPEPGNLSTVPPISLVPSLALFDVKGQANTTTSPTSMDALGQSYGFVLYEHISTCAAQGPIVLENGPRDRVIVLVNEKRIGVIDVTHAIPATVNVTLAKGDVLQLFVENLGRIDYGQRLKEQIKGILGNVSIGNGTALQGWSSYSMPLADLSAVCTTNGPYLVQADSPPVFYKGTFRTPIGNGSLLSRDTFLSVNGIKGVVWVNGINLGRYWTVGPQQSLYVPGCYLKDGGDNELIVLELEPQVDVDIVAEGTAVRQWANRDDPDAS